MTTLLSSLGEIVAIAGVTLAGIAIALGVILWWVCRPDGDWER